MYKYCNEKHCRKPVILVVEVIPAHSKSTLGMNKILDIQKPTVHLCGYITDQCEIEQNGK
jgi:hypothetical protein